MEFVKGQKIICVDSKDYDFIKQNKIYEVLDYNERNKNVYIKPDYSYNSWYRIDLFRTIIQSIDDVVVGMKLTYKGGHQFSDINVGTVVTVRGINDNWSRPIKINGDKEWLYDLEHFKEYQPVTETKDDQETYKVIKPFTVFDIWESQRDKTCEEFLNAWQRLLFDLTKSDDYKGWSFEDSFIAFGETCVPPVMWYYRKELCKRGFIKKKEKNIILEPGMRLKDIYNGNIWKVIDDQNNWLYFLDERRSILFNDSYGDVVKSHKDNISLNNFNKLYAVDDSKFEVMY